MKVILLAGGVGTRLWPFSRSEYPKQFIHFGDGISLLQRTLNRFASEEVWISTHRKFFSFIDYDSSRLIDEPLARNTGPAIVWAVKHLIDRGELESGDCFLIAPTDHIITKDEGFLDQIKACQEVAREGNIVTFGIEPTRPESGYGYLQMGEEISPNLFRIEKFIEKPPREVAKDYLLRGDMLWNSGMFLFERDHFLSTLKRFQPDYFYFITASTPSFAQLPALSIDHAIMEKTSEIAALKLSIEWSDVGSWDSVYDLLPKDSQGNVFSGNIDAKETKNCLIMGGKRLIATQGIEDLLIVETEDAIYISPRGESQKVKSRVEELREKGSPEVKCRTSN